MLFRSIKFREELFDKMGLPMEWLPRSKDRSQWPALREALTHRFKEKTRDQWCEVLEGSDACFAPVLSMAEAPSHPHHLARQGFVTIEGQSQPGMAPRFGRTQAPVPTGPEAPGDSDEAAMLEWGYSAQEITALRQSGALLKRQP